MKFKKFVLCVIFLAMFILGTYLLYTIPTSVKIYSNMKIQEENGDFLYINIISPHESLYQQENGYEKKNVIFLLHDGWQNKETMKALGIELATAGFLVVSLDFRGLGRSSLTNNITEWKNDIVTVKAYLLEERNDINTEAFGIVGHGLGGIMGYSYLKDDLDIKAYVGIGTGLSYFSDDIVKVKSRFLNLLIIHPRFDQTVHLIDVKSGIAARLSVHNPDVDINKLYGDFRKGTASMIYLDDNSNHLTAIWDPNILRMARFWMVNSFPHIKAVDENFHANFRALILIIQLVGGLGFYFSLFSPISRFFLGKNNLRKVRINVHPLTFRGIPTRLITYPVVFSFPAIVLFSPIIFFLPLPVTGFILTLFLGQVAGFLILSWRIGKRTKMRVRDFIELPFREKKSRIFIKIALGIILFAILFGILYLSIGMNYLGIVPPFLKIPFIAVHGLIGAFILLVEDMIFRLIIHSRYPFIRKNLIKMALVSFGYQSFYYFTYILSFCIHLGNYHYFGIYMPIGLPVLLLISFISSISYQKTGNVLTGMTINTLFIIPFLCTLSFPQNGFTFVFDYVHRVIANYLAMYP
ncbi:MAG: alpha/beta hydrolase [Promethearchaeota archaeon]